MRKGILIFLTVVLLITYALAATPMTLVARDGYKAEEVIRIHIRANSNAEADQSVKFAVRDELLLFFSSLSEMAASKVEMQRLLLDNNLQIQRIAEDVLSKEGAVYGATVRQGKERFPTRVYGEAVLPCGEYDALIVELGSGEGDNWWCIAFPPLCFGNSEETTDDTTQKVPFRSRIAQWFRRR